MQRHSRVVRTRARSAMVGKEEMGMNSRVYAKANTLYGMKYRLRGDGDVGQRRRKISDSDLTSLGIWSSCERSQKGDSVQPGACSV